jgi:hypothetical protein
MKNVIQQAIESKNQDAFNKAIQDWAHELHSTFDEFTMVSLINELKAQREGKRGRVASPFTEEVVSVTGGKRGRPALSTEEKLERLQLKLEKEKEAIIKATKFKEYSKEELEEINKQRQA